MTLRNPILTTLLAPALLLGACQSSSYTKLGTVSATPTDASISSIDVELGVGNVRLRPGPLQVDATVLQKGRLIDEIRPALRFEDHVRMEVVDGSLQIRSARDEGDDEWRFDLELQVPDSMALQVKNGVGNVQGEVGNVRSLVTNLGVGDLDLKIDSVAERLVIGSGVGDTSLTIRSGVPGEMQIESGIGDIDVDLPKTASVAVQTENGIGDVSVRRALNPVGIPTAQLKIGAGTGDIRVR